MKTAEEILKTNTGHAHGLMDAMVIKSMKEYALEACKETLKNAVNHLDVDDFEYLHRYGKCFKHVLSEDNIPKEVKS